MIKKYIENTEEVRHRLTRMLMDDASEMCRYERDIYMYIDEDGQARLAWFENPGGNSWLDDDHILLHVCRPHYEGIEDSIDGPEMLADIIGMTGDQLCDAVCTDEGIERDLLRYADCISWALSVYGDMLLEWYEVCIEDAASDYADQADEIMRAYCRCCYDDAALIEEYTNAVPIVWLFVIDADDQRALDKQKGGESNGCESVEPAG